MQRSKDMTEGPPFGLLVRFGVPLMIGDVFQQLYTIADSVVVGRLIGINAFAAVSAAGFLYWLVLEIVMGFSHGAGTRIAQLFGAKAFGEARRTFATSILLALVFGAFLSVLCVLITMPVLRAMNTPTQIIADTAAYLHCLFGGLIPLFAYTIAGSSLRATGDSKTPLTALILASIINVTLDILLVVTTPLGVVAVAIATVIGQTTACVYLFYRICKNAELRPSLRDFCFDPGVARVLLRMSLPIGARNLLSALGGVVIQYIVNGYGTIFIAGVAAAKKLYSILFLVGSAMEGAVVTYVAQNYGAQRLDRIKDCVRVAKRILLASSIGILVLFNFCGRWVIGLLLGNGGEAGPVLDVAMGQLRICLLLLPALYLLFLYRSCLQGMGNTVAPMVSGFLEAALRIVAVLTLPRFLGEAGVYISEAIGWPVCALQLYLSYTAVYRRKKTVPGNPIKKRQ